MNIQGRVYIVILNWNGWKDTLECLESVFRLRYTEFRVVVCDNASSDGSVAHILDWAAGTLGATVANPELAPVTCPHVQKPIAVHHVACSGSACQTVAGPTDAPLQVLETGGNLGFAGGCNVGLRHAMSDPYCAAVWLLNNDTVAGARSLAELVAFSETHPQAGIIGSTIRYYYQPERVQVYGGTRYIAWSARTPAFVEKATPQTLDCVLGASMLVTREFLETVGLLSEDYFLYFEELDWAQRAQGRFALGYAPESVVFHKEGASIGSNSVRNSRSVLSDRFLSRNRILFTRKFHPVLLPTVVCWVGLAILARVVKGDVPRASAMLRAAIEGIRVPHGK